MAKIFIFLAALSVAVVSAFSIKWVAPTQREDGSKLNADEIAGYHIYYGVGHGNYVSDFYVVAPGLNAVIPLVAVGITCAVVTTVDVDGRESLYSDEVCRSTKKPRMPFNLRAS